MGKSAFFLCLGCYPNNYQILDPGLARQQFCDTLD